MKLTYWYAECNNDSDVYSIRTRTKREAKETIAERGHSEFGLIRKVTIEYKDAFDLMQACSMEDHHWWEFSNE